MTPTPQTAAVVERYAGDPACLEYREQLEFLCISLETQLTEANAAIKEARNAKEPEADLLSFEDRCRAWLEKQPGWEAKVELGKLLMIPLMELSSDQLARLEELREVLKNNANMEASNA